MLGHNAKVMKVPEMLNEAGDRTANFFKTKAEKESELESELEEKKPPDFGMLDYNDKTNIKNPEVDLPYYEGVQQEERLRLQKEGQQEQDIQGQELQESQVQELQEQTS